MCYVRLFVHWGHSRARACLPYCMAAVAAVAAIGARAKRRRRRLGYAVRTGTGAADYALSAALYTPLQSEQCVWTGESGR